MTEKTTDHSDFWDVVEACPECGILFPRGNLHHCPGPMERVGVTGEAKKYLGRDIDEKYIKPTPATDEWNERLKMDELKSVYSKIDVEDKYIEELKFNANAWADRACKAEKRLAEMEEELMLVGPPVNAWADRAMKAEKRLVELQDEIDKLAEWLLVRVKGFE